MVSTVVGTQLFHPTCPPIFVTNPSDEQVHRKAHFSQEIIPRDEVLQRFQAEFDMTNWSTLNTNGNDDVFWTFNISLYFNIFWVVCNGFTLTDPVF